MLQTVLRDGALDVTPCELSQLSDTTADVVVLAGDAPGALEALRRLRDDGPRPDVPVVLVGAPPGLEPRSDGPAFGAEWALSRDVAPDRLVRVVREVAARAVVLGAPRGHRERTLDLGRDESQVARVRENEDGSRSVGRISDVAPAHEPGSGEIALRAPISLELEAILRAGAARALPNAIDVDVSLPAGEDAARDLVPDEFIAVAHLALDDEEPAADSLTFVGGPAPLPESRSSRTPPAATPAGGKKTFAGAALPPRPSSPIEGARAVDQGTRSAVPTGSSPPPRPYAGAPASSRGGAERERSALTTGAELIVGEGNALALLRALYGLDASGSERTVRVRASEETVELSLAAGVITRIAAPVAQRVLEALGQRPASGEVEAEARIDALVLGGLVPRARRARTEEAVRRAVLTRVLRARNIEWKERTRPSEAPGARLLPGSAARELCDAAAQAIDGVRAAELLGGMAARVVRTSTWERGAAELGAPTALDGLLDERGMGLGRLAIALADEPGLCGRIVALVALGALEVRGLDAEVPEDLAARARARSMIEEAVKLAEDADYFALLGVVSATGDAGIADAHAKRTARLRALDLPALGLDALSADRDVALAALDEARRVLSRASWREAYASALARS